MVQSGYLTLKAETQFKTLEKKVIVCGVILQNTKNVLAVL